AGARGRIARAPGPRRERVFQPVFSFLDREFSMSSRFGAGVGRWLCLGFLAVLASLVVVVASGRSDDAKPGGGIGQLESAAGTLLSRQGPDKAWKVVADGATIPDRDVLL